VITSAAEEHRLRVVSWNVHGCVGTDRRFAPERIAAILRRLKADVVLLQEVGDIRGVHPPVDQASTIAEALGFSCAVGITVRAGPYGYGNATLTRFAVVESESIDLSVWGREPRLALRAVVGHDELRLTTLNVHLGLGPEERRTQLRRLLPAIDSQIGQQPVLMGGDFNDFPPGPVTLTLRHRMIDAAARIKKSRTFPSRRPLLRLDRIYVGPGARVIEAWVVSDGDIRIASDHLPVLVELGFGVAPPNPRTDPP
jgi:endonuclease/exonuclease/phosphatase family metal-dependent hydrolase